ncbi:uncharacterized protein PRCAT00000996001 [Priceomyces carsonii]|uniref:uncharacterized protein n=1 Tax=Priceomyces carsonii TaxID=28549 RepID=UPI002ED8154E|nr:unnamed protein product [Priceomyces carsonii]
MKFYYVGFFFWVQVAFALLRIENHLVKKAPNALMNMYDSLKNEVYVVSTINDVNPSNLEKYGVIKVLDSKSVIVSRSLTESALSNNYKPERQQSTGSDNTEYYEVDFSNTTFVKEKNTWTALTSCRRNEASTVATYGQGWSVSPSISVSSSVQFAQMFGIQPLLGFALSFGPSLSGSLSCDVNGGETLQFQILPASMLISNVRERRITIEKGSFFKSFSKTLTFSDWKDQEPYSMVEKNNVQTACVTNPLYLKCY